MVFKSTQHGTSCDCPAHRAVQFDGSQVFSTAAPPGSAGRTGNGAWSALLPALACAVCPACIAAYAKLGSVIGVGFGLSESIHLMMLVVAIAVSIGLSAWRSHRSRHAWPIAVALAGSLLVVAGHWSSELHLLEWLGVLVLLGGGLTEHVRLRRAARVVNTNTAAQWV